jgi:hypothetical protein
MSSQELDWELGDIFDGGIFAFPVDEPGAARAVIRYLMMRGILAEEVADAIEQPGSTADLVAWLNGDERKSMIGVWATAWLNDARRRHDTDRRRRRGGIDFRSAPVDSVVERDGRDPDDDGRRRSPSPGAVDVNGGGRRQMSLDSDFGGSEESISDGSRKGSFEGACGGSSDHVTTDEDEIGSCARERYGRSNSDDNVMSDRVMTSYSAAGAAAAAATSAFIKLRERYRALQRGVNAAIQDRPRSEVYVCDDIGTSGVRTDTTPSVAFPVPPELSDSGNVSVATAATSCDCCIDNERRTGSPSDGSVDSLSSDNNRRTYYDDDIVVAQATKTNKRRFRFRRRPNTADSSRTDYQSCAVVSCRCTLSHYAASASLQTVVFAASRDCPPGVASVASDATQRSS